MIYPLILGTNGFQPFFPVHGIFPPKMTGGHYTRKKTTHAILSTNFQAAALLHF